MISVCEGGRVNLEHLEPELWGNETNEGAEAGRERLDVPSASVCVLHQFVVVGSQKKMAEGGMGKRYTVRRKSKISDLFYFRQLYVLYVWLVTVLLLSASPFYS